MKKIPNIYFVGKAGAGKTFGAKHIIKKYGSIPSKFAYPVYNLAYNYFDMQVTDRKLLQIIGTDIGRTKVSNDIWIKRFQEDLFIVKNTYKKLYNKEIKFVSDDVRFKNEHELLKNLGWLGLYLDVSDEIRIKRLIGRDGDAQIKTLKHSSETAIDTFKDELVKVDSSGTLEETYANIDKVIRTYMEGN